MTRITPTDAEVDMIRRRRARRRRFDPKGITPESALQLWDLAWIMRRREGVTAAEFARRARTSKVTVHQWERGMGMWQTGVRFWRKRAREKGFTF